MLPTASAPRLPHPIPSARLPDPPTQPPRPVCCFQRCTHPVSCYHRGAARRPARPSPPSSLADGRMGFRQLERVATVSLEVGATSARLGKVAALAAALTDAAPDEVPIVVAYLSGELPQRQIGVGWAALRSAPAPAPASTLTVADVGAAFTEIRAGAGKGSAAERKRLVESLFGRATEDEQYFLIRLLSGELRQGALDGVMTDAVAQASA